MGFNLAFKGLIMRGDIHNAQPTNCKIFYIFKNQQNAPIKIQRDRLPNALHIRCQLLHVAAAHVTSHTSHL